LNDHSSRLHAVVRGDVQGVGFRYFVQGRASALGLNGWVRNRADGSVECVAEGPKDQLRRLLADLEQGPSGASVDGVEADWTSARGDVSAFSIH
jgi:acylphosphatase